MFAKSAIHACIFSGLALMSWGCADSASSSDSNSQGLTCGPNSTLHQGVGQGAEPHCDCNKGYALYDNECIAKDSPKFNQDTSSGGGAADAGSDAGNQATGPKLSLPASCWTASAPQCDPRSGQGCDVAKGDTCDIGNGQSGDAKLQCFPGPNTQTLNRTCDTSTGPFCAVGLTCIKAGVCKRFCCDNGDCGAKESCKPFSMQLGTLGFCDDGKPVQNNKCVQAWGPCQTGSDCCSKQCHSGHCH